MKALRLSSSNLILDSTAADPAPEPGWALIQPILMGVSSSDIAAARGLFGFQGILGHEFVGKVLSINDQPDNPLVGSRVVGSINIVCRSCDMCRSGFSNHCRQRRVLGLCDADGCFAERFALPAANLVSVPDAVSDQVAVFSQVASVAVHARQMVHVKTKPYITVLGDGVTGLLIAQSMAKLNASVRLLGHHPERFGLCERWGIKHRHIDDVGRRQDQDIVVDCTGSPDGATLATRLSRPRGKIILKSTPAPVPSSSFTENSWAVDPVFVQTVVANELEVVGCRCGMISEGLKALAEGSLDVTPMISRPMRLDEGVSALRAAIDRTNLRIFMEP